MNYAGAYVGPDPPEHLAEIIELVGGRNLYGRPNFRLVHAGFRLEPAGGTWVEWDESLDVNQRTAMPQVSPILSESGSRYSKVNNPWRSIVEVRMSLKYPEVVTSQDGSHWWVLEKWHGPDAYGSPEKWYLPASSGGTMIYIEQEFRHIASQGDFPYEGAYEHTNYEFPQCALTEAVVLTAVQRISRIVEDPSRPATAYGRMLRRVYEQQEMEKRMAAKRRQRDLDIINDCDTAFGNAPASFGGHTKRKRSVNTFAERAGIRVHTVS